MTTNPGSYQIVANDQFYQGNLQKLLGLQKIKVHQKLRWGEAFTLGCCEQNNHYSVMNENEEELFRVLEDSECMTRLCCSPLHTTNMKIVNAGEREPMADSPMLMFRPGCECIGCPKCLCCFACNDSCNNEVSVFSTEPTLEGGKFKLEEKVCNGCSAEIVIYHSNGDQKTPLAIIHGPTFFGGCAELCSDADFYITTCDKECNITGSPGDVARLRKLKPSDCMSMCLECCTDVDRYEVDINTNCNWNSDPNFLGMVLSSLFTLDFMFFEADHPYVDCNSDGSCLYITICNFYCYGCICPVQICIPTKGGDG